jgi:hypothetical protein
VSEYIEKECEKKEGGTREARRTKRERMTLSRRRRRTWR